MSCFVCVVQGGSCFVFFFCVKRCWWKVNKVVFCMYVLCKVIVVMRVLYELLLYEMSEGVVSSLEVVELGVQLGI